MFKYLPNILSFSRIIIAPLFIFLMIKNTFFYKLLSLIVFFFGSLSDALDGFIARKFNIKTELGKYIDPLADKILIITAFCIFSYFYPNIVKHWMILIILLRDVVITIIRHISINKNVILDTTLLAKIKTFYQIVVIHILLFLHLYDPTYITNYSIIYILMMICIVLSLITAINYIIINFSLFRK